MAREIARGQIWQFRFGKPDKRRPVLVLSRNSLLRNLHTATVAVITTTRRGSPVELDLGVEEGLKQPSCVNLANVFTVRQADLRRYVGSVDSSKMAQVCRRVVIAFGCD